MNEIIIKKYINMLTENNIIEYGKKNNVNISKNDANIIYYYIQNYWKEFYYGFPKDLLNDLKSKLDNNVYNKLEELYFDVKEKLNN